MLRSAIDEAKLYRRPDQEPLAFNGYRYEAVRNTGDETTNYNLYVVFSDPTTIVLDPRNLNGASQAILGQYLTPEEIERLGIGKQG